jgi:hypothetical protein
MRSGSWLGSLVAVVALTACGGNGSIDTANENTASRSSEWSSDGLGVAALRGHEDITRFAVENANNLIKNELGVGGFFPTVTSGDSCKGTSNNLLNGDCHTDWPDDNDELVTYYGVSASDWQTDPRVQELHFLRNYPGDQLESAKQTCVNVQGLIVEATKRGLNYWAQNNKERALYWFGHSLHMIQDSFAPPHTRRGGYSDRVLSDVCTYAKEFSGVCYHEKVASGDRVWSDKLSCQLNPNDRSWGCLVTLAQEAANASTGYLRVVARHIQTNMAGDVAPALNDWYSKASPDVYESYFDCNPLPGPVVYPDAGAADADSDASSQSDANTADGGTTDAPDADPGDGASSDSAASDGQMDSATTDSETPDSAQADVAETDSAANDGGEVDAGTDSDATDSGDVDSGKDSATENSGKDTGVVDSAVDSGKPDSAVDSGKVDSAVDSGKVDSAVDSGKVDSAVDSGKSYLVG